MRPVSNLIEEQEQYNRRYAGPLDVDTVFSTTAERLAYLTELNRYPGMPVSDLQTEKLYILNAATTAWVEVGGGGSGGGTVTSVGLALPASVFNVTVPTVTTSGILTATFQTQTANRIFAGPATGAAAAPTFRALVAADITGLVSFSSLIAATATNTINNAALAQEWQWNSLITGAGLKLSMATAAQSSTAPRLFEAAVSGVETGTTQSFAGYFSNTRTGSGTENIAIYATASGGTNNFPAVFDGGVVKMLAGASVRNQPLEILNGNNQSVLLAAYLNENALLTLGAWPNNTTDQDGMVVGSTSVSAPTTGFGMKLAFENYTPGFAFTERLGYIGFIYTSTSNVEFDIYTNTSGSVTKKLQIAATGDTTVSNGNLILGAAGNKFVITEGSNGSVGQTTLVSGTKAITITGLTTSSRAFITLVTPSGATLTIEYQAVCTANTLTIQANVAAGTINTADGSTLNYFILN